MESFASLTMVMSLDWRRAYHLSKEYVSSPTVWLLVGM